MAEKWTFFKDPDRSKRSEVIGQIVELMLENPLYSRAQLRNLSIWIIPPVYLNQAKIFYGPEGHPLGYVVWAGFSEVTTRRARQNPQFIPHLTEWNEGGELWITDMFAKPGAFSTVCSYVRDHLYAEYGTLQWVRSRSPGGAIRHFRRGLAGKWRR